VAVVEAQVQVKLLMALVDQEQVLIEVMKAVLVLQKVFLVAHQIHLNSDQAQILFQVQILEQEAAVQQQLVLTQLQEPTQVLAE
jgi:hypothetical protein